MIPKDEWIWMPHPAHLIVAHDCRFHLATKVGKYIVSTVGEYFPDSDVREIIAQSRGIELKGIGDERRSDCLKKIGYVEIGYGRRYETMVFTAKKNPKSGGCCPWIVRNHTELECEGYNDPGEAYLGHLQMCEMYSSRNNQTK